MQVSAAPGDFGALEILLIPSLPLEVDYVFFF